MTALSLRYHLEALKLAYEVSLKNERDLDNPRLWNADTDPAIQEKYFQDIFKLADMHYDYIIKDET